MSPRVHPLPGALLADLMGDEFVKLAGVAEHEDVVVGDGAEGLVLHRQPPPVCSARRWISEPVIQLFDKCGVCTIGASSAPAKLHTQPMRR